MEIQLFNSEDEVNAFLGIQPIGEPDLSWVQPHHHKATLSIVKLFNVFEAHNKANNYIADWDNTDQIKYNVLKYIEANKDKCSGFGFSNADYDYWLTSSDVGSRLSVGTVKEIIHIGTKFEYLFEDLFFIDKKTE